MNSTPPSSPHAGEDAPLHEYRVLLFARLKELAGCEFALIRLPSPTTVQQLQQELARAHPELGALLAYCSWAVDSQYAGPQASLSPENEVACIPPVSGG